MMPDPVHPVIESHYLETEEGLFFAVKGLVHPADLFLACLRYAPDPNGERGKAGNHYRRLYHFEEQEEFLQKYYPKYLAFEPTIQATLQSVPRQSIRRIFDPRSYLQELQQRSERDPVEDDALNFTIQLQKVSGIPFESLGISGSLLIGMHTGQSDLDISVYGVQNCQTLHKALKNLLAQGHSESINPLDPDGMEALYTERSGDTKMDYEDFFRSERNKINQGQFGERVYFIRFLKEPEETGEKYGDYRYLSLGQVEIQATVTDNIDAIFTPCRYSLTDVRLLQGSSANQVQEIVSYRARFCDQARVGDPIQASGTLEQVQDKSGFTWHRLLLGNAVEDTMFLRR
jgi:Uncharacterized protein conserved in archaea